MNTQNLVFFVGFVLTSIVVVNALPHHNLAKRSTFFEIDCRGVYDRSIFFRLDRICEDCYSLFREPELLVLCKWVIFLNFIEWNKMCFTWDPIVHYLKRDESSILKEINHTFQVNTGTQLCFFLFDDVLWVIDLH